MAKNKLPEIVPDEILWRARKRWTFLALPWTFTVYRLTKDRLFIKTGFFTTKEDEIRLYRIMDISLWINLLDRKRAGEHVNERVEGVGRRASGYLEIDG